MEKGPPDLEKALSNDAAPKTEVNGVSNGTSSPDESEIVDWNGPDDPENPQNWSLRKKWWLVGLVSAVTFNMYVVTLRLMKAQTRANS